jgi:hypothetical protein
MAKLALYPYSTLFGGASVDVVGEGDGLRWSITQSEGGVRKPRNKQDYYQETNYSCDD